MKTKTSKKLEGLKKQLDDYDDAVIARGALDETEQADYDKLTGEFEGELAKIRRESDAHALGESLGFVGQHGQRPNSDGGSSDELSTLVDQWLRGSRGDRLAADAIARHNEDAADDIRGLILRASTTADFGGLMVPDYLTAEFAEVGREGRAFADSLRRVNLLKYVTVIPVASTGAAAAAQAAQNTAFASADPDADPISVTASAIGGFVTVPIQAVELGAVNAELLASDLIGAYHESVGREVFWGSGSGARMKGVFTAVGTQTIDGAGSTSVASTMAQVGRAAARVRTIGKRNATHVCMSSARWWSLLSETDDDGRPLLGVIGSSPSNVAGDATVGRFAGLTVVVDDGIHDNGGEDDDRMIVYSARESLLLEANGSRPQVFELREVLATQGSVVVLARNYAACTFERRPKSVCIITNMGAPAFDFDESA